MTLCDPAAISRLLCLESAQLQAQDTAVADSAELITVFLTDITEPMMAPWLSGFSKIFDPQPINSVDTVQPPVGTSIAWVSTSV